MVRFECVLRKIAASLTGATLQTWFLGNLKQSKKNARPAWATESSKQNGLLRTEMERKGKESAHPV